MFPDPIPCPPAFDAVATGFRTLVERGKGDMDYSALVTLLEEGAGVRVAEAPRAEETT